MTDKKRSYGVDLKIASDRMSLWLPLTIWITLGLLFGPSCQGWMSCDKPYVAQVVDAVQCECE